MNIRHNDRRKTRARNPKRRQRGRDKNAAEFQVQKAPKKPWGEDRGQNCRWGETGVRIKRPCDQRPRYRIDDLCQVAQWTHPLGRRLLLPMDWIGGVESCPVKGFPEKLQVAV